MLEHKGPQVTKETDGKGRSESTAPDCKNTETWHDSRHVGQGSKRKGPRHKPTLPLSTFLSRSLKNMHSFDLFNNFWWETWISQIGNWKQLPLLLCTKTVNVGGRLVTYLTTAEQKRGKHFRTLAYTKNSLREFYK